MLDRNENRIAVLVFARGKITFKTNPLDDIEFSGALPEKYPCRLPRLGQHLGGNYLDVVVQDVLALEVKTSDHAHIAIVRDSGGLADGNHGLRQP